MSTNDVAIVSRARSERGTGEDGARPTRPSAKSVVLTIAGSLGVVALLWLAASAIFGWSLIVFTTGSMSPTMPTGTAAVSEMVDASALAVGDVVTVQRDGARLPVTHRVVSVGADQTDPNFRSLVLRGDANAENDQFPYRVAEAQRVLIAVPGLGTVMAFLRTPFAMGAITIIFAALVVWAFWPERSRSDATEATS